MPLLVTRCLLRIEPARNEERYLCLGRRREPPWHLRRSTSTTSKLVPLMVLEIDHYNQRHGLNELPHLVQNADILLNSTAPQSIHRRGERDGRCEVSQPRKCHRRCPNFHKAEVPLCCHSPMRVVGASSSVGCRSTIGCPLCSQDAAEKSGSCNSFSAAWFWGNAESWWTSTCANRMCSATSALRNSSPFQHCRCAQCSSSSRTRRFHQWIARKQSWQLSVLTRASTWRVHRLI